MALLLRQRFSQKHISERVGVSYPTSKAIEILEEAARLGYETIVDFTTPNKHTVKQFRDVWRS